MINVNLNKIKLAVTIMILLVFVTKSIAQKEITKTILVHVSTVSGSLKKDSCNTHVYIKISDSLPLFNNVGYSVKNMNRIKGVYDFSNVNLFKYLECLCGEWYKDEEGSVFFSFNVTMTVKRGNKLFGRNFYQVINIESVTPHLIEWKI